MTTLVMAMNPQRAEDVCDAATRLRLDERFDVRWGSDTFDADELARLLPGSDVVVTSWGTPKLTAAMLSDAAAPKIIAHAAGTVKNVLDPDTFDLNLAVFSAGVRIAESVGEYCLAATLTMLRRLPAFDQAMRVDEWKPANVRGRELTGKTVGIVGASSTARAFISLLKPFRCDVVVYDPYLSDEKARQLGVRRGELEEVVSAPIVSLHVPNLPATEGMITSEHIKSMQEGALLINSSTGPTMDYDALEAEISKGRVFAALDVYPQSPPALSANYTDSPNVLLTPHIAGDSVEGHQALVGFVIKDVVSWLEHGQRGESYVDLSALSRSA
ncbi:hydroxyacid dehydrogenase [Arthrobacter sp. 18067]|uniref:hydroxyacid dehydrogenase n=1 Tax=Arthrobacter sp. 18067 TaxID=2681413 RepID=UPI001356AB78|nr:hydroxyacid dehydrogenase [Arthrobacter sp. 18067]